MSARETHRFVMICRNFRVLAFGRDGRRRIAAAITVISNQMRLKPVIALLTCLALASPAAAAPVATPHEIEIAEGELTLHAQLYKPDGEGPFPTVIALHGCGGLAGRAEPVLPRYREWAEQFVKDGKAVLLPDSFGSRGLGPQCRVKEPKVRARRERVEDIMAARQWLTQQTWVAQDRISLIGWAHGASALLWAVRPQLVTRGTEPDFRSAVAFYPNCRISAGLGWSTRVPTLLLIGSKDDVSSPSACRQMIDGAQGRSALTRMVVFPGAYHDFDRANLPVHAANGSPDAATPEHGHIGTDPEARAEAQRLVTEWLAR